MKKLIGVFVFVIIALSSYAQNYNTAAGIRISDGIGLTVQQRITNKLTIEGVAFTNVINTHYVAALGEYHGKLIRKGFNWYVGAGLHSGIEKDETNPKGMLFVAGLEMKIKRIVISADVMPRINFVGGSQPFEFTPGFSARYILIERPKEKIFDRKGKKGKDDKKDKGGIFNRN